MADKRHLMIAVFEDEATATEAAKFLRRWDRITEDVDGRKYGGIGVLTAGEAGEIKVRRVGRRDTGTGVGWGLAIGLLAGGFTAGLSVLGGVAAGAFVGGVGGGLIHKGLGMTPQELKHLSDQLCSGNAGVAIVVHESEVQAVSVQLVELGGQIEVHECSLEHLKEAAKSAGVAPETQWLAED
jgi:uncharacterized membrane protein